MLNYVVSFMEQNLLHIKGNTEAVHIRYNLQVMGVITFPCQSHATFIIRTFSLLCIYSDMKSLAMRPLPSGLSLLQPYKLQGYAESNTWTWKYTTLLSHKDEHDSEAGKGVGNQCSKPLPWVVYFRKLMFVRMPSFWRLPPVHQNSEVVLLGIRWCVMHAACLHVRMLADRSSREIGPGYRHWLCTSCITY